jgi:hypothetical protein
MARRVILASVFLLNPIQSFEATGDSLFLGYLKNPIVVQVFS